MDSDDPKQNQPVSYDAAIDMDVINEAVNATSGDSTDAPHAFSVEDIKLDNTPTSAEELREQQDKHPEIGLSGSATESEHQNDLTSSSDKTSEPLSEDSVLESGPEDLSGAVDLEDGLINELAPNGDQKTDDQESEFVIDSEKTQNAATQKIGKVSNKAQDSAKKALSLMKPKNTQGIVIVSVIVSILILVIVIAIMASI